jgi:hypothetical protein
MLRCRLCLLNRVGVENAALFIVHRVERKRFKNIDLFLLILYHCSVHNIDNNSISLSLS